MTNKINFLEQCLPIDFETTGLDFHDAEVIELGFAGYDAALSWSSGIQVFFQPSIPISPKVSSITDITDEMVMGHPEFSSHGIELIDELSATYANGFFVAHNAFYDKKILDRYKQYPNKWLCTMRLAKRLYCDDPSVEEYKLPYLRYRFKLPITSAGTAHRAGFDAHVTGKLLEFLIDQLEERNLIDTNVEYLPQLVELTAQPIVSNLMTFGKKYKGMPMTEVPLDYYKWMLGNCEQLDDTKDEYDMDLAESVAVAMEKIMS